MISDYIYATILSIIIGIVYGVLSFVFSLDFDSLVQGGIFFMLVYLMNKKRKE